MVVHTINYKNNVMSQACVAIHFIRQWNDCGMPLLLAGCVRLMAPCDRSVCVASVARGLSG